MATYLPVVTNLKMVIYMQILVICFVIYLSFCTSEVLGFEHLRDLYEDDIDFQNAYRVCKNHVAMDGVYVARWLTL